MTLRSGVTCCAPSVTSSDTGRRSALDSGTSAEGRRHVRGAWTALANYRWSLVAGLGGDPATLLRAAGVRDQDVGNYDASISIRAAIRALNRPQRSPPQWISGDDWHSGKGLRSWDRSVWLHAATVGDALAIFNTFMAAYSLGYRHPDHAAGRTAVIYCTSSSCSIEPASHLQTAELARGARVIRCCWAPTTPHWPCTYDPLTPEAFYLQYFAAAHFAERYGFTMRTADLSRPNRDDSPGGRRLPEHRRWARDRGTVRTYRAPVAAYRGGDAQRGRRSSSAYLHPKTLQRRLARRTPHRYSGRSGPCDVADRYLRTTGTGLTHWHVNGAGAEQSVLTCSLKRRSENELRFSMPSCHGR